MNGLPNIAENRRTRVARLTARVPAGIASIGLSGPGADAAVLQAVRLKTTVLKTGRVHYGLIDVAGEEFSGSEQVVVCRTRDDRVELHCHGGEAICQTILQLLERHGCEVVQPEEWLHESRPPTIEQAERDLLVATTDRTAGILLDQMNGALHRELMQLHAELEKARTEEDPKGESQQKAEQHLHELLAWKQLGTHLSVPWQVTLAGPPNVGKSSLANQLLGQNRSIVHSSAGTTRDRVETLMACDGWPIALSDTAGIRRTEDSIEKAGVQFAQQHIEQADLILVVVDATVGWTESQQSIVDSANTRTPPPLMLVVWNKVDLAELESRSQIPSPLTVIQTTCTNESGVKKLQQTIASTLAPQAPNEGQALPFRESHFATLELTLSHLRDAQYEQAISQLASLVTH